MVKNPSQYTEEDLEPLEATPAMNRLTMTVALIHHNHGEQPTVAQDSCWKWLETKEESWSRRLQASTVSQPLVDKHCWLEEIGYVFVQNLEGVGRTTNPTEEEAYDSAKRILEVSAGVGLKLIIPPGWCQPISVENFKSLEIRSKHGTPFYRVTVFPK